MTATAVWARRWVIPASLALWTAACGASAEGRLSAASQTVGDIRSGVLDMRMSIASVSAPDASMGFAIEGPFEVHDDGLEADLRYRQLAGTTQAEVRFVAVDGRAFVESEGSYYELPIAEDAAAAKAPGVLQDLDFESWAADPRIVESGPADQVTIVSPLDETAALDGLGSLLEQLDMKDASGLTVLRSLDDGALARSVQDGSMTVRVGTDDDLLRALVLKLRFGLDPSSPLADVLREVAGARLLFSVEITHPNQPVRVVAPREALPFSELPGS
jgi:hypothetical protein